MAEAFESFVGLLSLSCDTNFLKIGGDAMCFLIMVSLDGLRGLSSVLVLASESWVLVSDRSSQKGDNPYILS